MTLARIKPETLLSAQLARESPGASSHICASAATRLCALGRRAKRLAERQCNGVDVYDATIGRRVSRWSDKDQEAHDRAIERIRLKADTILEPFGARILSVSGDPRGFVLRIALRSGSRNNIGKGWGL